MDPDYQKRTPELRHSMAEKLEDACLEAGGEKVISVTAGVYDVLQEETILTSNGFEGETQTTFCYASAEMTAQDKGDRRPQGYYYAMVRALKALPSCAELGKKAAERTMALMGSKKIATETLPIIIENHCVASVLYGFLSAMNGWVLQQKRSFLLKKKG